jgi:hypothetical protein
MIPGAILLLIFGILYTLFPRQIISAYKWYYGLFGMYFREDSILTSPLFARCCGIVCLIFGVGVLVSHFIA